MNRGTEKSKVLKVIDRTRKIIPQVAIRTSIITGFPSETDEEFKELLNFVKDVRFERLGAFVYSREEDTPACNMKKQIPEKAKAERLNQIMLAQQRISEEINKKFLGLNINVLIDEIEGDSYLGRSQYDAPEVDGVVYVHPVRKNTPMDAKFSNGVNSKRRLKPGDFVKVKITDTLEYDLVGEVIG
jgi:ribosomal protein S12 methylthiotransferase